MYYLWRDSKKFASKFIEPIAGYIMTAIILAISAFLTYFGFSFWGLDKKLHPVPLASLYVLISILVFVVLVYVWAFIVTVIRGKPIEISREVFQGEFGAMYEEDKEFVEIPVLLTVKNRTKHDELLCFANLEKFSIVYDEELHLVDDVTKRLMISNLLDSNIPRLRWNEINYESPECEMKITPNEKRNIEIARFKFLLKNSFEQGHPKANLGIRFCKDEQHHKTRLGLYEIRIAINYQKNGDEIRTEYYDGYIYADVFEKENFEDDIRNRMKGKVVVGSGSWERNKELPR
jgi:hypothetical protein